MATDKLTTTKRFVPANIQRLVKGADVLLESLGDREQWPDEQLRNVRSYAEELGKQSWRVQCACDAELLRRALDHKGSDPDEANAGSRKALVRRIAREVGCVPQTIYRNAQIWNTFIVLESTENGRRVLTTFSEKYFFIAALSAPDPLAAIQLIANAKQNNPRFSVRDANRLVRNMRRQMVAAKAPPARKKAAENKALHSHLRSTARTVQAAAKGCPWPRVVNQYNKLLRWIDAELNRSAETDLQRLIEAWAEGNWTVSDLVNETGLDEETIDTILIQLEKTGQATWAPQAKTDQARGARTRVWTLNESLLDAV